MYILMLKHAAYIFVHFIGVLCSNDNVAKWKNSNSQYLVYFLLFFLSSLPFLPDTYFTWQLKNASKMAEWSQKG